MVHNKPLIILSLALTLLISFDHLAAWTVPPSNPPSGNIAAPLNTGSAPQDKTGALGVGGLAVFGQTRFVPPPGYLNHIVLTAPRPTIKLESNIETNTDWWMHTNGNTFHFLPDRNGDGVWSGEQPWPLTIQASSTHTGDFIRTNQVRANQYCDANGQNCGGGAISASGIRQVNGGIVNNLTPGQPVLVYYQRPIGGTYAPVVTRCNNVSSIISTVNPSYWKGTDRGTNPPQLSLVVVPVDGCIRARISGGDASYTMVIPLTS